MIERINEPAGSLDLAFDGNGGSLKCPRHLRVVAINKAVADILGEYKTPRPDPDQTLTHLTGKLKAARVTNNELKAATEASGIPKQLYGGLAHLEALVEKKCGKQPGFFNTKRKEAEVKQKTVDLTKKVEEERKEKITAS